MTVLSEQARLYATQAAEPCQAGHEDALNCRRLEELVGVGVALWGATKQQLARRRPHPSEADEQRFASEMLDVYRALASACASLRTAVARVGERGFVVDGLDGLVRMHEELQDALAVPFEKVTAAHRQIREGRTHPMGEVRRELQRRLHG